MIWFDLGQYEDWDGSFRGGGGGSNDVKNENEGFDLLIKDLGKMWKENELHNLK